MTSTSDTDPDLAAGITQPERVWASVLALTFLALAFLGVFTGVTALRATGTMAFMLWGVGSGLLTLAPDIERGVYVVLACALSIAISVLVATVMTEARIFQPSALGITFASVAGLLHLRVVLLTWRAREAH